MNFINSRAKVAGGFVLSLPLEGVSLCWLFYKVDKKKSNEKKTMVNSSPEVYIPSDEQVINRELPEELKDFPIWWLE